MKTSTTVVVLTVVNALLLLPAAVQQARSAIAPDDLPCFAAALWRSWMTNMAQRGSRLVNVLPDPSACAGSNEELRRA